MCTLHTTMLCEPTIRLCVCACFLQMLRMQHQGLLELSWRSLHCRKQIQALATPMQGQCNVVQNGATTIKCGQASHFPPIPPHFPPFPPISPHFPSFSLIFPISPHFSSGLLDTGILRIWILPGPGSATVWPCGRTTPERPMA